MSFICVPLPKLVLFLAKNSSYFCHETTNEKCRFIFVYQFSFSFLLFITVKKMDIDPPEHTSSDNTGSLFGLPSAVYFVFIFKYSHQVQ